MLPADFQGCGDTREQRLERLKQLRAYPLAGKVAISSLRIKEWYEKWGGNVHVTFSGGKDSTALLHLVRSLYPEVPAVFSDTGLEYPEIKAFVKTHENVTIVRPTMSYRQVVEKHGYAVPTKRVATMIKKLRRPQSEKNAATRRLYLEGITKNGTPAPRWKLPQKWRKLLDAPFKISDECCHELKQKPFTEYEKATGSWPLIGTMTGDSTFRSSSYLDFGCNAFDTARSRSAPLSFWQEADIWEYLRSNDIPYCSVYDTGIERTGCLWCLFGVHMEDPDNNRLIQLQRTHPKIHSYAVNDMGLGEVCEYIGVKHSADESQGDLFEEKPDE